MNKQQEQDMNWLRKNIAVLGAVGTLVVVIATQAMAWQATKSSIEQLQSGQSEIQKKVNDLPPPEWRWRVETNERAIESLTKLVDESRNDRAEIKSELKSMKLLLERIDKRM